MSTIEAKIVSVEILPHENAERLELARIGGEGGWICVVGKGQFKTGDLCLYIPEDSVLSQPILDYLALNSKIAIHGGRIRPTRIRGVLSQGLCLSPAAWCKPEQIFDGSDVTTYLGITKFEPPPPRLAIFKPKGTNIAYRNENFKEYKGIERFQKNPKTFSADTTVAVTVKYHGTNFRAGFAKKPSLSLLDYIKRFLGLKYKETEFLVGSHEKIRKPSKNGKMYEGNREIFKQDLYWRAALKYDIEGICKKIIANSTKNGKHPKEVVIYGEIIGPGIQTGYDYGIPEGDIELRVFDIMEDGEYLPHRLVTVLCNAHKLPHVEELYYGPWKLDLLKLAEAVDEYGGKKYVREGIVLKGYDTMGHRSILKHLNPAYLLDKKNSEFH